MPESVSTVDAILDGLRDRATGWSCVPLADAEAAVHAAADLASPDERLREAAAWLVELAAAAVCEPRRFAENETELQWKTADAITATRAALAAADREAPDEP